mgnify:CR=1 FL=1
MQRTIVPDPEGHHRLGRTDSHEAGGRPQQPDDALLPIDAGGARAIAGRQAPHVPAPMWRTGARVSEVLALTPERILGGNDRFDVLLKAKRTGAGRPGKLTALRSRQRCVPLIDEWTQDRLQTYLCGGHFRATQRLFAIAPQTLNRHIHRLADAIDFPAHWITATTFRHSFAINLLVHGCPLSAVARLLGHKHLASTAIYEQALTVSDHEMIKRVEFH